MIRSIIEETGVKIDIEDDGTIKIASSSGEAAQKAIELIKELTATAEIGKNYMGKVKKVVDFGAFVAHRDRNQCSSWDDPTARGNHSHSHTHRRCRQSRNWHPRYRHS